MYYTLDGSSPTGPSAVKYSGPVGLPVGAVTLTVVATAPGYATSVQAIAHYTIIGHVATPTASPAGGAYVGTQTVTLSTTTPGAVIYYTLNGSTPSTTNTAAVIYTHPLTISSSVVLKACATASGLAISAVDSETYTIQAATPIASLASGSYVGNQVVSLACATPNAVIYYSLDGSTPAATNAKAKLYSKPLTLTTSVVLKACAVVTGLASSTVATYNYTIQQQVAAPIATPAGGTYIGTQSVGLSSTTPNAVIYYTLDGSTPSATNANAQVYTTPLTVTTSVVLKACAAVTGMAMSAVVTNSYTILPQVASPTFSPAPGTFANTVTVSMACTTAKSTIRYTLDGTTPTSTSMAYTTPLTFTKTTTVTMMAFASGIANSHVVMGQFIITQVPLSKVTLSTSVASPLNGLGTPVTLTAIATGGVNNLFDFRISYVNSAGHTVLLEAPYSSANTFVWTPTVAASYTLAVWAKSSTSTTTTFDVMASEYFLVK